MNYNYDNDGTKVGYRQLENMGKAHDINAEIEFGTIIDKGALRDKQKKLDGPTDHREVFMDNLESFLKDQSIYRLLNKDDLNVIKSDKSLQFLHIIQCKSAVLYVLGYIFNKEIGIHTQKISSDNESLLNTISSIASTYNLSILSVLRYARFWADTILKKKKDN